MEPHAGGGGQIVGVFVTLVIVMGVMLLRNRRPRRLRPTAMWIRPLIYLALIGATLFTTPASLTPLSSAVLLAAVIVGAALGWLRGKLMRIDVHPETHDVSAQASPVGMVFILAVLVARMALRDVEAATPLPGLSAAAMADALILLAGAMMIARGLEMWLRSRRLLAQARTASSAGPGAPIVS